MALLSNYKAGGVIPFIEIAQIAPLSSTTYQAFTQANPNSSINQIELSSKLVDTNNLATLTLPGYVTVPPGRWSFNIKTCLYSAANYSSYAVGLSCSELNDFITLEHPDGGNTQGYSGFFNFDGVFINNISYTLSLAAIVPGGVGAFYVGIPGAYWNSAAANSYGLGHRQNYKRASLKLWKLQ